MNDTLLIDALSEALEDEYRARATYRKVVAPFGPVRLLSMLPKRKIGTWRHCSTNSND